MIVFKRLFLSVLVLFSVLYASPVDLTVATKAAEGWQKQCVSRLGEDFDKPIEMVEAYINESGKTIFYAVSFDPQGFVIFSADDEIMPVIAFDSTGEFTPENDNPFFDIIFQDMAIRTKVISSTGSLQPLSTAAPNQNQTQWAQLIALSSPLLLRQWAHQA